VRQTILGFRAEALEVRTLPRNLAGSMSVTGDFSTISAIRS
jgi:hypothetical protein